MKNSLSYKIVTQLICIPMLLVIVFPLYLMVKKSFDVEGFGNYAKVFEYFNLFINPDEVYKERKLAEAISGIKRKYGKSSVIKAMNLEDGATTLKRNKLIGGHNADVKEEDER